MLPEISKRCLSCGAAVRVQAMFCPECGRPLSQSGGKSAQTIAHDQAIPVRDGENATAAAVHAESKSRHEDDSSPAIQSEESAKAPAAAVAESVSASSSAPPIIARQPKGAKTRETLHRASTAARGALEDNVKRVEKIRQVSSVVLEEAHYDPSLRFVLVAVGVFIVFVILLVLSKVMG